MTPRRDLGKILFTPHDIERRVMELGKDISIHYRDQPITVVGVLKGAIFFLADLVRQIESPLTYDFFQVESYNDGTRPAHPPVLRLTTRSPLAGHDVLLVEDIVDTGHTVALVRDAILAERPRSLKVAALLDKHERREVEVGLDWVGFRIPNRFVVGYGLDHAQRYRNLPYLAFLNTDWVGPSR